MVSDYSGLLVCIGVVALFVIYFEELVCLLLVLVVCFNGCIDCLLAWLF